MDSRRAPAGDVDCGGDGPAGRGTAGTDGPAVAGRAPTSARTIRWWFHANIR